MPSNIDYDPKLLSEAQKIGHFKFKKDAVNAALKEFVDKRKQKDIFRLFGKIEYEPSYDSKAGRSRKCKF